MSNSGPRIKIFEIPAQVETVDLEGNTAIVIDVLRATSSMATALQNGCLEIYPVTDVKDAFVLKQQLNDKQVLLCGERKGVKIEGFDLGNSPFEYKRQLIEGKTLIWTTSNGTKALSIARNSEIIYAASLLNAGAIADAAAEHGVDINIICAGTNGQSTLEDNVCAGLIINEILNRNSDYTVSDLEKYWAEQAKFYRTDLYSMMLKSKHGQYLVDIGFDKDLKYCSQFNIYDRILIFDKRVVKPVL